MSRTACEAAGHLAAQGWLKAQIAGGRGHDRDQRQPSAVLEAMHKSDQGIQVLAEALAAGRRNTDARALTADGQIIEQGGGDTTPLSNVWIRSTFKDANGADAKAAPDGEEIPQTARERVAGHIRKAEGHIGALRQTLEAATEVEDGNAVGYLERHGWSRGEIEPLVERLRSITQQLEGYALRAEVMQDLPPASEEQLGFEEALEETAA